MKPNYNNTRLNTLLETYPHLFSDSFKSEDEGFRCADGWYHPIRTLCEVVDRWETGVQGALNDYPNGRPLISCVKQKFGSLVVYFEPPNKYHHVAAVATCALCDMMCEECGTFDNLGVTTKWIRNLCEGCAVKFMDERKSRGIEGEKWIKKPEPDMAPFDVIFKTPPSAPSTTS